MQSRWEKSSSRPFMLTGQAALLVAILPGCATEETSPVSSNTEPPPPFVEVAQSHGLVFTLHSGHHDEHFVPQITVGGGG